MATFLNHVAIAEPRNGTNAHTADPSSGTNDVAGTPFTPTAGRLLVCVVEGPVTSTTPSGWSIDPDGDAVSNTGLYVFYREAAGGDTFSTVHNGPDLPVMFDFYEFPEDSAFLTVNFEVGVSASGGAGPSISLPGGAHWVAGAVGQVVTGNPGSAVSWSAGTEATERYEAGGATDGYAYGLTYFDDFVGGSASVAATLGSGVVVERLMFAVTIAADPPPEGGAVGTITWAGAATGKRIAGGAATGAVSLAGAATGKRIAQGAAVGAVSLTGAATGKRIAQGAAVGAVSLTGAATGKRISQGSAVGAITWVGVAGLTVLPPPASRTLTVPPETRTLEA